MLNVIITRPCIIQEKERRVWEKLKIQNQDFNHACMKQNLHNKWKPKEKPKEQENELPKKEEKRNKKSKNRS